MLPLTLRASGSLSLARARESNQREHAPTLRFSGFLPEKSAPATGFRWTYVHVHQRNRRDPRAAPNGLIRPLPPQCEGTQERRASGALGFAFVRRAVICAHPIPENNLSWGA